MFKTWRPSREGKSIHWIRIRIQSESGSNPKLDPIRNRAKIHTKVFLKKTVWIKKCHIPYVFIHPYKGSSGFRRSLQLNRKLFNKHEISSFFLFWGTTFACLDPDPLTHSNPDPIQNGNIGVRHIGKDLTSRYLGAISRKKKLESKTVPTGTD